MLKPSQNAVQTYYKHPTPVDSYKSVSLWNIIFVNPADSHNIHILLNVGSLYVFDSLARVHFGIDIKAQQSTGEQTQHLYNTYTTLAQRLRRWTNIV